MQLTRKILGGIGAVAVVAGTAACSSGGASTDAQELVVQTNWNSSQPQNAPLVDAVKNFTEETGIKVKLVENGDDLSQNYETSLLAGDEADVVMVNLTDKQLSWAEDGAVIPVQDFVSEWGLEDSIPQTAIDEWTDDQGNLRGFPYSGFTWPWWYNTELLAQVGVDSIPETTDDLIAASDKLRAAGIAPVVIGGNDWSGQKVFLQIMQSYMSPDETKDLLGSGDYCGNPDAMKGIEEFTKLRDAGVFVDGAEGYTVDQAASQYFAGKAAIAPMGSWSYKNSPAEISGATTLGGFPIVDGGSYDKPTAYTGATGSGFWVSPNGEKKLESVEKFVTYMYTDEVVGSLLTEGGIVPLTLPEGTDVADTNPLLAAALTELPESVDFAVMPDLYIPAAATNPMYRATSIAFTQGKDAAAICAALDEAYAQ